MFYFSDDAFALQEESRVRAMAYESVKEKLSGVTKDERCRYNKFKDEDHYTSWKYVTIHGTAAVLQKFKKLFPHYSLTESAVRAMHEKYHWIVKFPSSSSPIKKLTSLKTGRPLPLGSLDEDVQKFLVVLHSKWVVVNTIVAVAVQAEQWLLRIPSMFAWLVSRLQTSFYWHFWHHVI